MMAALRARAHRYQPDAEVRCLVVAPHEDDATLGCGGLILRKRLEGSSVDVAYITDGSASHPGHPTLAPEALALQRRSEALAADVALGVERSRIHFLGARDGKLGHLSAEETRALVDQIAMLLVQIAPDEIFLPCRRDGSSEHDAAFNLVQSALESAGLTSRLFEYPIWALWAPQRLVRPLLTSRKIWRLDFAGYEHLKHRALGLYHSQVAPTPPWSHAPLSPEFLSFFRSPEEFFFEMPVP
jgi:LmbE family N-acetylglucosaminyl deacetylase